MSPVAAPDWRPLVAFSDSTRIGYGRWCSRARTRFECGLRNRPKERRQLIIRRVATGVSPEGKSEVVFDGDTPGYFDLAVSEFDVIWLSDSSPPDLLGSSDPADVDHYVMKPPPGGIKWVVIRIPPESESSAVDRSSPEFAELMSRFDDGGVMEPGGDGWHATQTLDRNCWRSTLKPFDSAQASQAGSLSLTRDFSSVMPIDFACAVTSSIRADPIPLCRKSGWTMSDVKAQVFGSFSERLITDQPTITASSFSAITVRFSGKTDFVPAFRFATVMPLVITQSSMAASSEKSFPVFTGRIRCFRRSLALNCNY